MPRPPHPDPAFGVLALVALAAAASNVTHGETGARLVDALAWLLLAWTLYRPLREAGRVVHGWLLAALALWAGVTTAAPMPQQTALVILVALSLRMALARDGRAVAAGLSVAAIVAFLGLTGVIEGPVAPSRIQIGAMALCALALAAGLVRRAPRIVALGGLGLLSSLAASAAAASALVGLFALVAGRDATQPAMLRRMPD